MLISTATTTGRVTADDPGLYQATMTKHDDWPEVIIRAAQHIQTLIGRQQR